MSTSNPSQFTASLLTSGGDADVGRRIAQQIRLWREPEGRKLFFLGKTDGYSAGIPIVSGFPKSHRSQTRDCALLVHERKLKKDVHLDGVLPACLPVVNELLAPIESGQRLEKEGFEQLVEGLSLSAQKLMDKVYCKDWYQKADKALQLGLVHGLI